MTTATQTERQEAISKLREMVAPGDTVYTILRHRARSGMSRSISLVVSGGGQIHSIDFWAARAMRDTIDRTNGGIKISGAGMDKGFSLVYNLGATLWPEGYECTLSELKCYSNDHTNRSPETHHRDGGYALRQEWL